MHGALFNRVAHLIAFRRAGATEGIMPAAGVRSDGEQYVALAGDQLGSRGEINGTLLANCILHAVTVSDVIRIVEKRVHRLVAFQIHNAEGLAEFDLMKPAIASGNDVITDRVVRIEDAF